MLVVQCGLNHSIADGLGDNVLGRLFALDTEAEADVAKGDARVGQGQHADSSLDDVLTETEDQSVGAVLAEDACVLLEDAEEALQITDTYSLNKAEVREKGTLERWLAEDCAVRDVTHEQFNDDKQLHGRLVEASGDLVGR